MSHKQPSLSNRARAFSIASLVDEDTAFTSDLLDNRMLSKENSEKFSPVHKKLKTAKPEIRLEGKELWNCFYRLGTEMIITKTGRRMFPTLRVSFANLDPDSTYAVMLDIVPEDTKRHRYSYADSAWFVAGEADLVPPIVSFIHPDSPFTGHQLLRQILSFEKVKLTNNRSDKRGNIILNSMHKYQPRIHLLKDPEMPLDKTDFSKAETFFFPETTFIAVTSYQNHLITRLKIYSNPFAKGFRDSIRFLGNTERRHSVTSSVCNQVAQNPNVAKESYLMSNGFHLYETDVGTRFLPGESLSRAPCEFFSDELELIQARQAAAASCYDACGDPSCCRNIRLPPLNNNSYFNDSVECARGSNDIYNSGHPCLCCPASFTGDRIMMPF